VVLRQLPCSYGFDMHMVHDSFSPIIAPRVAFIVAAAVIAADTDAADVAVESINQDNI
jgi:hypothetical protein